MTRTLLRKNSTVEIDNCTVYHERLLDEGASIFFGGCGCMGPNGPVRLVASEPSDSAIDARQPFQGPESLQRAGTREIMLEYSTCARPTDVEQCQLLHDRIPDLPSENPPSIIDIDRHGRTFRLVLDGSIFAGAWTRIGCKDVADGPRMGFLPGDINGDGTSESQDVSVMLECLQSKRPCSKLSSDVDRSEEVNPLDLMRVLDLLNGGIHGFDWNGRRLP